MRTPLFCFAVIGPGGASLPRLLQFRKMERLDGLSSQVVGTAWSVFVRIVIRPVLSHSVQYTANELQSSNDRKTEPVALILTFSPRRDSIRPGFQVEHPGIRWLGCGSRWVERTECQENPYTLTR
jgi:hypothetical protein